MTRGARPELLLPAGRVLALIALVAAAAACGELIGDTTAPTTEATGTTVATAGNTTTVAEGTLSSSSTTISLTSTSVAVEGPVLVPRSEWPDPVLDPVLALAECGDASGLATFMAAEFPDAAGYDLEPVEPLQVAQVVAMPRTGYLSLFGTFELEGACLAAGRRGPVLGWALYAPSGQLIAQAAGAEEEMHSVPEEVIGGNYHQSAIASGHWFNASVDADGRTWGVIGSHYTVLEAPDRLPAGDLHAAGERLATSLAIVPFLIDRVLDGAVLGPEGLPAGYGPCLSSYSDRLGAEVEGSVTAYCNTTGDYIIQTETFDGTGASPVPDAALTAVGPVEGRTWVEGTRRIVTVAFSGLGRVTVRLDGPSTLEPGELEAVLASTLLLQPEVIRPRQGGGDLTGALSRTWLEDAVKTAGAVPLSTPGDSIGPPTIDFTLESDIVGGVTAYEAGAETPVDLALVLPATGVEALDPVDVLVRDTGEALQMVFTCGGVVFNGFFQPAAYPAPRTWSQEQDRYPRVVEFTRSLIAAVGCTASTTEASGEDP